LSSTGAENPKAEKTAGLVQNNAEPWTGGGHCAQLQGYFQSGQSIKVKGYLNKENI
jgi:hypothetical protein